MGRLLEIEARLSAISAELNNEDANLDALGQEIASLKEERKSIMDKAEQRKSLINSVVNSPAAPIASFSPMQERNNTNELEKRAATLVEKGTLVVDNKEARSILLSTGTLAKPSEVGGINEPFNIISSIVDMVMVEDLTGTGNYKEAYLKTWQTAAAGTDGTAPTPNDPTFRTVAITPFLIDTLTYVSKNIAKQTPLQYEEKVRKGSLIALKKKVTDYIIKGNGSTAPFGIYNAVNTQETPETMTQEYLVAANTIDAGTLRKIVFAYGGDENVAGGARLILNKNDLIAFGDVRGTNEKKAIYEIIPDGANPNIGIIKDGGLSVPYVICSDVTALSASTKGASKIKTMLYGAPGAYKLGLYGNYEITVSQDYKFAEGLLSVKGEVMVGGNVVVDKGFVVVTLEATGG